LAGGGLFCARSPGPRHARERAHRTRGARAAEPAAAPRSCGAFGALRVPDRVAPASSTARDGASCLPRVGNPRRARERAGVRERVSTGHAQAARPPERSLEGWDRWTRGVATAPTKDAETRSSTAAEVHARKIEIARAIFEFGFLALHEAESRSTSVRVHQLGRQ